MLSHFHFQALLHALGRVHMIGAERWQLVDNCLWSEVGNNTYVQLIDARLVVVGGTGPRPTETGDARRDVNCVRIGARVDGVLRVL